MNFSLIIFSYNEAGNIAGVTQNAVAYMEHFALEYEIVLVNDGSSDNTHAICDELVAKYKKLKVIHHSVNMGIGMALRSGYEAVQNEYVCAIPGDGQFNIEELRNVQPFTNQTYYSFYRPQTNYSWYRKCLTWLNRLFNQHILAVYLRDVNWIKVYRKEQLQMVKPELRSSLIESEICAKLYKRGVMPIEIPSAYLTRNSGEAKGGSWKTLRKAMSETLKLWWVVSKYKY